MAEPEQPTGPTAPEQTQRTRPLIVQIGEGELILLAADVNLLVDAIDQLHDSQRPGPGAARPETAKALWENRVALDEFKQLLLTTGPTALTDPPLLVDRERVHLLKQLLSDISGYQRGELTQGLRRLRQALTAPHA